MTPAVLSTVVSPARPDPGNDVALSVWCGALLALLTLALAVSAMVGLLRSAAAGPSTAVVDLRSSVQPLSPAGPAATTFPGPRP